MKNKKRNIKRGLSLLLAAAIVLSAVGVGFGSGIPTGKSELPKTQAINAFDAARFRRPAPDITLDMTDVTRVGAAGDVNLLDANNNTIKKATPSGIPYNSGTYAWQSYAGETPVWPTIAFTSSLPVNITGISFSGASIAGATTTVVAGASGSNTTACTWELHGGTASANNALVATITYTYTWANPYTGVNVTDTYTVNAYSRVERVLIPSTFFSISHRDPIYSNAYVPIVSQFMGKGVYAVNIGMTDATKSGYMNMATNSFVLDATNKPGFR